MWTALSLIVLLIWAVNPATAKLFLPSDFHTNHNVKRSPRPLAHEVGSKLILTPYIEAGNIKEARTLSAVSGGPFPDDIPSYSGFFTVNKLYDSNLFFWFFPAEQKYETAPLLLWLQGGPGGTSLFGLFNELGPFSVASNGMSLIKNPYSWHKNHSIIFIDNPVGTGFSFTNSTLGYARDQVQVGAELYSAIIQFLQLFPEMQRVPFFITGESYAGKYVPALGYTIHLKNPTAKLKVNLHGIAVGNGLTDPINMLHYSDFLYQMGLVDTKTYNGVRRIEEVIIKAIDEGRRINARELRIYLFNYIVEKTAVRNIYNLLSDEEPRVGSDYLRFVQLPEVRLALHVGDQEFIERSHTVYKLMTNDHMNTLRPWLEELIENYRVLYYSGQLDIILAYPLSVGMYNKLQFKAAEAYRNAERVPWYVDGRLAGYMKSGGKFTEVLVRNAGHMVPSDQPVCALDLITRFTSDKLLPVKK